MTTILSPILAFLAHTDLSALLSSWWGAYVSSSQAQVKCELILTWKAKCNIENNGNMLLPKEGNIWSLTLNSIFYKCFTRLTLSQEYENVWSSKKKRWWEHSTMRRNVIRVCPLWSFFLPGNLFTCCSWRKLPKIFFAKNLGKLSLHSIAEAKKKSDKRDAEN